MSDARGTTNSRPAATGHRPPVPLPELAILETRVYRGANIWSYDKAIHLVVDLGGLEDWPTDRCPSSPTGC